MPTSPGSPGLRWINTGCYYVPVPGTVLPVALSYGVAPSNLCCTATTQPGGRRRSCPPLLQLHCPRTRALPHVRKDLVLIPLSLVSTCAKVGKARGSSGPSSVNRRGHARRRAGRVAVPELWHSALCPPQCVGTETRRVVPRGPGRSGPPVGRPAAFKPRRSPREGSELALRGCPWVREMGTRSFRQSPAVRAEPGSAVPGDPDTYFCRKTLLASSSVSSLVFSRPRP